MLNKKLIKIAKTVVGIILVIVLFTSGYITGDRVRKGLEEKEGKFTSNLVEKTDKNKDIQCHYFRRRKSSNKSISRVHSRLDIRRC